MSECSNKEHHVHIEVLKGLWDAQKRSGLSDQDLGTIAAQAVCKALTPFLTLSEQ